MTRFVPILLAALLSAGAASAAPAATRTYDCAKAGNATKAVCKGTATTAKTVAKKAAKAAVVAPASKGANRVATATTAKITTPRNFDCTKAGNANKTQCKTSAVKTATVSKPVASPRPMARPAAASARRASAAPANSDNRNPAGAIAQCKDGMYSHSAHRDGACARHGGVARWS